MDDPLLPRDPADEEHVRFRRIDSETLQRRRRFHLAIFVQVDAVVDHVQPLRRDVEEPLDDPPSSRCETAITASAISRRRLLQPDGEIVAAAELLAFPGPQRLQRMDRDHERNAVVHLREDAAPVAVPSVAMHQIGIDLRGVEIRAALHRAENRTQRRRTGERRLINRKSLARADCPARWFWSPKQRTSTGIVFASSRER